MTIHNGYTATLNAYTSNLKNMEFQFCLSGLQAQLASMTMWVQSLTSLRGSTSSIAMTCGVGHRRVSDPILLRV